MTTYLVTGANSGLGLETTRALAARGARIILAVRDLARGQLALDEIARQFPHAKLELHALDLADLASVRALAERDLGVDVLINNAGMGSGPRRLSAQGVVEQFAVNHLGHFALVARMLPALATREAPRIVTVASGFGRKGALDLANLDGSRGYSQGRAYMQSKLANALFAAELDRRLRAHGSRVKSVIAHPGIAATPMQQKPTGVMGVVSRIVSAVLARSAANGALPIVEAATGAAVHSGDVYGPGKGNTDPPRKEPTWPSMTDLEGARALWIRSEQLTGLELLGSARGGTRDAS